MTAKTKREVNPIEYHAVMIALSRARAMAYVLDNLSRPNGAHDVIFALDYGPEQTREWLHSVVAKELHAALGEAQGAFRKSLTSEQARDQVLADIMDMTRNAKRAVIAPGREGGGA